MENFLTEEQFHAACTQWYWNTYKDKRLFCINNNVSKRVLTPEQRAIEGNRNKAMGVMAGVSDLIFISAVIIFIELKMKNGVQSIEQKEFERMVEGLGHPYFIVRTLEQFKNIINSSR